MRTNHFIKAKVLEIRNRKAQRLVAKKHALVYYDPQVYRVSKKKVYTTQQVNDFKNSFKKEIASARKKTILTWVITILGTPVVMYILYQFISWEGF